MSKFKVGDKVRITKEFPQSTKDSYGLDGDSLTSSDMLKMLGELGVIVPPVGGGNNVKVDGFSDPYYWQDDDLIPVVENATEIKPITQEIKESLRPGARVTCIKGTGRPAYFTVGKTYEVGKDRGAEFCLCLLDDEGDSNDFAPMDSFALATEEQTTNVIIHEGTAVKRSGIRLPEPLTLEQAQKLKKGQKLVLLKHHLDCTVGKVYELREDYSGNHPTQLFTYDDVGDPLMIGISSWGLPLEESVVEDTREDIIRDMNKAAETNDRAAFSEVMNRLSEYVTKEQKKKQSTDSAEGESTVATVIGGTKSAGISAAQKAEFQSRFKNVDVGIVNEGTKIILPTDPFSMSKQEAIDSLTRAIKADEEEVSIHEEVDAYPLDGAFALMKSLELIYGWVDAVPTPGFFGPVPPSMVTLEVGYKQTTQVLWGGFKVPNIDGQLETGATSKHGRYIFCISGKVKKKCQGAVKQLADAVRDYVSKYSVYKSQAVRLITTDEGEFDPNSPPVFLNPADGKSLEQELTFSKKVYEQVNTSLFTPLEHTQLCRDLSIPLKRTVLLEGKFGTGKTLTATVASYKATLNGWTYIYLDRVTAMAQALVFARQYAPAVIFAEDIDRATPEGRTVQVDDILNNLDGIDSKKHEVITILTTNHVEKIEPAMLRPGRFDAIISVTAPDAEAAEKLMRLYARGLIRNTENLTEAGKELDGQIPAVIREVVERAKLYAISRCRKGETVTELKGQDLAASARGMKAHLELMNPKKAVLDTPEQALGNAFKELTKTGVQQYLNGTKQKIKEIHKATVD